MGIASVVRNLDVQIADALDTQRRASKCDISQVWTITKDSHFPVRSAYQPGLLGMDRMLGAVGGVQLVGKPVITVDIGSAVTIDLVDGEGVFRGGLILAGAPLPGRPF